MKQIQLTQGQVALVDDEDFERVNAVNWCASRQGKYGRFYAVRFTQAACKRTKHWMHRLVMKCPDGLFVDHIDGNGLNNCKQNLRVVTFEENAKYAASKTNGRGYPLPKEISL